MAAIAEAFFFVAGGSLAVGFGTTCFLLLCMRLQGTALETAPRSDASATAPSVTADEHALGTVEIGGKVFFARISFEALDQVDDRPTISARSIQRKHIAYRQ